MRALSALVLVLAFTGQVAAQSTVTNETAFRHERTVIPGGLKRGPQRLALDPEILAGSQPFRVDDVASADGRVSLASGGMGDLRLFDSGGREVQYLLIAPQLAFSWRSGRILKVKETRQTSGFEVDFGSPTAVDRLRVNGLPAPFLKRVRLEGSGDRTRWTLLVAEGTLFELPDESLARTTLEFEPGSYRYLRLTWDDRSSGRMPLPKEAVARLYSPVHAPPPLRDSLPVERRASEPGKSRYRLKLPGAHLPIVALELSVGGMHVMRTARVTEARLEWDQVVPTELGSATLRRDVRGDVIASELSIPITPPTEAQIDLVVDDGDNPPLDLTGVTAVYATLPFVYFESPDGKPLTARYGADRLAPPQYDLEVSRERIPGLTLADAKWGAAGTPHEGARVGEGATATSTTGGGGAAIDVSTFRYSRSIPKDGVGLAALKLDPAALAHAGLPELRISTPDGRQVPYLVERLDEPLSVELPVLEPIAHGRDITAAARGDAAVRSRYRVRLPYSGLPASRLVLHTTSRVFSRRVSIEAEATPSDIRRERETGNGGGGFVTIAAAEWRHDDPETPAPALTLALPSARSAELYVVVDEGDNAALAIDEPTLLLPSYRLRFFRDGRTQLSLLYGRPDLAAPRYDLTLLAPRLLGAPAEEISPGPEQGEASVATGTPIVVFWGVLGVAVVALLLLIARLLRPRASARGSGSGAAPAPPASPA